jgi:hypothetical protein
MGGDWWGKEIGGEAGKVRRDAGQTGQRAAGRAPSPEHGRCAAAPALLSQPKTRSPACHCPSFPPPALPLALPRSASCTGYTASGAFSMATSHSLSVM